VAFLSPYRLIPASWHGRRFIPRTDVIAESPGFPVHHEMPIRRSGSFVFDVRGYTFWGARGTLNCSDAGGGCMSSPAVCPTSAVWIFRPGSP
jgi:hypothetical protein